MGIKHGRVREGDRGERVEKGRAPPKTRGQSEPPQEPEKESDEHRGQQRNDAHTDQVFRERPVSKRGIESVLPRNVLDVPGPAPSLAATQNPSLLPRPYLRVR